MPVHKRMDHSDQKVCIIGEIENYVASMLRAQKFNDSHTDLSVLRSLKMLREQSAGSTTVQTVQDVQAVQVVKTNALGSEIFEHPATRLDSRRFENLTVPREIEG